MPQGHLLPLATIIRTKVGDDARPSLAAQTLPQEQGERDEHEEPEHAVRNGYAFTAESRPSPDAGGTEHVQAYLHRGQMPRFASMACGCSFSE